MVTFEPAKQMSRIVKVDYRANFRKLVETGKYDYIGYSVFNRKITNVHHRNVCEKKAEMFLLNFSEELDTQTIISRISELNFLPATSLELLALGAQHPELQLCFPIIALGSRFVSQCKKTPDKVLSLCRYQSLRILELCILGNNWLRTARFAALRQ